MKLAAVPALVSPARAQQLPERIDAYPTHQIGGFAVRAGHPLPFGATPVPGGINFSVYSNHATAMTLVLFRRGGTAAAGGTALPAVVPDWRGVRNDRVRAGRGGL